MAHMNSASHRFQTPTRIHPHTPLLPACYRGARIAYHIIYGIFIAAVYPVLGKPAQRRIMQYWSRKFLNILHVGLETNACLHPATTQGCMLVANHVSWLDAVALNAVLPAYFVTPAKVEIWPLLSGMRSRVHNLSARLNTLPENVHINEKIAELLQRGESVALFPEVTTTGDAHPGHFHSSLLQGPIDIAAAIYPVAIRYHDGAGEPNNYAACADNINLSQSLWKILRSPALQITLLYLPPLPSSGKNRRLLASEARSAIHTALTRSASASRVPAPGPVPTEQLKEKSQMQL